jgi:hypothetical protein
MFSADVFSADVTIELLKSTIEEYSHRGKVCLVTYTNNKISDVTIVDKFYEPCVISSGSFNPPHEAHVTVLKTCKDHWTRMNRSSPPPTCLFELSISNADKGLIDTVEVLTRILYFTQSISVSGVSGVSGVCEILESNTFCVAVTKAAMFLDKKLLLCNNENSVFCVGIDTLERIIMPKYYEPVKSKWNDELQTTKKSITGITEALSLPAVDDKFYINMLQVPLYVVGRTINGVAEYLSPDYDFVYEREAYVKTPKDEEKDTIMKTLKTGEISTVLQQKVTIVTTEDGKPFVGAQVSSSEIRIDPAFEPMKTNIEQFIKKKPSVQPVTVGGKRIKRKTRKNKRKNKSKSRKNKKRYTYKK